MVANFTFSLASQQARSPVTSTPSAPVAAESNEDFYVSETKVEEVDETPTVNPESPAEVIEQSSHDDQPKDEPIMTKPEPMAED